MMGGISNGVLLKVSVEDFDGISEVEVLTVYDVLHHALFEL